MLGKKNKDGDKAADSKSADKASEKAADTAPQTVDKAAPTAPNVETTAAIEQRAADAHHVSVENKNIEGPTPAAAGAEIGPDPIVNAGVASPVAGQEFSARVRADLEARQERGEPAVAAPAPAHKPPADANPGIPAHLRPDMGQPGVGESGLRDDGPTLEEYVAAGYPAESYPPPGYKPKVVKVTHYKVERLARYVKDGNVTTLAAGTVVDVLNYDINEMKAQGVPLTPINPADVAAAVSPTNLNRYGG